MTLGCVLKESMLLPPGKYAGGGGWEQSCRRAGGGGWRQQMEKKGRICIGKHMGGKINQA